MFKRSKPNTEAAPEKDAGAPPPPSSLSYRDAGVDIDAATESLSRIKETVARTFDDRVLRGIGDLVARKSQGPTTYGANGVEANGPAAGPAPLALNQAV